MDKIMTKRIQTKPGDYFSSIGGMTRPEVRCLRDMAVGILKSKTVFVNRIAASLREPLKMKDVCKRLSSQYLKRDYAGKVLGAHLDRVCLSELKRDDGLKDIPVIICTTSADPRDREATAKLGADHFLVKPTP